MGSSWTRDPTHVPYIGRWILNHCTTREAPLLNFRIDFLVKISLWGIMLNFETVLCRGLAISFPQSRGVAAAAVGGGTYALLGARGPGGSHRAAHEQPFLA